MMASTAAVARVSPANMVAPFNGLRSTVSFPATRKANNDLSTLPSNGGKASCMQVWPPEGLKKFETLSYLPPLSVEALAKEVEYLLRNGWVPCIEFSKVQKQKKNDEKKILFSFKSGPDSFRLLRAGRVRLPSVPRFSGVLRWSLLDHVEAAHVRVHRRRSGDRGGGGGQEGLPQLLRQDHRLRQQAPGAVHQLHRLQAHRCLSLQSVKSIFPT